MITLAHLRVLLQRARDHRDSAALLRLPKHEQTVFGVCFHYIGSEVAALLLAKRAGERRWANLSESMRARASLVALALALGLDPGVGGLDCSWSFINGNGWIAATSIRGVAFGPFKRASGAQVRHVHAPTVAAEPDPIKALALAALHVLEHP